MDSLYEMSLSEIQVPNLISEPLDMKVLHFFTFLVRMSRGPRSLGISARPMVEGKRESALLHEVNVHPFAVLSRYFYLFIRPCTSVPTVCICSRARGPGRRGHTLARAARAHAAAKLAACSAGRSETSRP